jgi:hypothetical protein
MKEPEVRYEISKPYPSASDFLALDNEPKRRGQGAHLIGQFASREAAIQAIDEYDRRQST